MRKFVIQLKQCPASRKEKLTGEVSHTVKPVLNGHSKIYKTKILITIGSLMKVESIAECSNILQNF